MLTQFRILVLLAILAGAAPAAEAPASANAGRQPVAADAGDDSVVDLALGAEAENMASANVLPNMVRWDVEKLRDLARSLNSLPEPVIADALWLAASAPPRFDNTRIFVMALSSPYPNVRSQAADILIAYGSPDFLRMLLNRLPAENDNSVLEHIVNGMARQPAPASVRLLMQVMLMPNVREAAVKTAAAHLRRLTRSNLPDNASAWREWWLDNSRFYD